MKKEELLKLGFKTTSSTDEEGNFLQRIQFKINEYDVIEFHELNRDSVVDICIEDEWVNVPNCKNITDMKNLINLFS